MTLEVEISGGLVLLGVLLGALCLVGAVGLLWWVIVKLGGD